MSDELESRNGHSVEIEKVIEVLERTPDRVEVMEALRGLRQDKVKAALGATVRAVKFDLSQTYEEFLQDGEKAERTQVTYRREIGRFMSWLERQGIYVLQVQRRDVNKFKGWLSGQYSANTVRLTLASCSAFWTYLEEEQYVDRSPFAHIKYPRRQYKKAIRTDEGSPVPVMNKSEYEAIMRALERKAQAPGDMAYNRASRESARRLLPLVHFMGTYGLRIGDVLTVTVKLGEGDRFSYRQKGGEVRQKALRPISREILSKNVNMKRQPFKDMAKSSVQGALRKLTLELSARGVIRYAYSCHDFRHYYAVSLYQETGDVYAVKESLGHANVAVTEVYLVGLGAVGEP